MGQAQTGKGIVEVVNERNGMWSFKVGEDWYGAGKYPPKFDKGDEIEFQFTKNGKWNNLEFNTVTVLEKAPTQSAPASSGSSSGGTNWDLKDKRITYLACRKDALAMADILVKTDAMVLPPASKKADRYQVILDLVDELTDVSYQKVYGESYTGE